MLVLQESQGLVEKRAVILEDCSMSSIRKDAQLRVWQLAPYLHRIERWNHHARIAIRYQHRMLNAVQRGRLRRHAPLGNRGHLGNDGLVCYRQIAVLLSSAETLQKFRSRLLAVMGLCEKERLLRMLFLGCCPGHGVLQYGAHVADTFAAGGRSACQNHFAHEIGMFLRDDLSDETTE